uniref:Uncharacterized protein n=1 Tax=Anguilla anguilla TaxID=7936 RepID=A0A0E9XVL0_ANGAN
METDQSTVHCFLITICFVQFNQRVYDGISSSYSSSLLTF